MFLPPLSFFSPALLVPYRNTAEATSIRRAVNQEVIASVIPSNKKLQLESKMEQTMMTGSMLEKEHIGRVCFPFYCKTHFPSVYMRERVYDLYFSQCNNTI